MQRIAVIGNAGGGKSTLARKIAARHGLPHIEIDALLWQPGWQPTPTEIYEAEHDRLIGTESWVIDGLGTLESIEARLQRATGIVFVDMPLWMHVWLAAERQIAWARGEVAHPPGAAREPPPNEALFRMMFEVDRDWLPALRRLIDAAEATGTPVHRINDVGGLDSYAA
jgi:adenylate kinase family enzyme